MSNTTDYEKLISDDKYKGVKNPLKVLFQIDEWNIETPDGCHWDSIEDAIYSGLLNMCGCGVPEDGAKYWRDLLLLIKYKMVGCVDYNSGEEFASKLFGDHPGASWVMYHVAENLDLTEHGGSAPGWLTGLGEAVVIGLVAEIGLEDVPLPDGVIESEGWKEVLSFLEDGIMTR